MIRPSPLAAVGRKAGRLAGQIRTLLGLPREMYAELRRVVWPGGREVLLTALAVGLIAAGLALLLWILDRLLLWVVGFVIGLRF